MYIPCVIQAEIITNLKFVTRFRYYPHLAPVGTHDRSTTAILMVEVWTNMKLPRTPTPRQYTIHETRPDTISHTPHRIPSLDLPSPSTAASQLSRTPGTRELMLLFASLACLVNCLHHLNISDYMKLDIFYLYIKRM